MTADQMTDIGRFMQDIERIEVEHGLFLKQDRGTKIVDKSETGRQGKQVGTVYLNGTRKHAIF